MKLSIVRYITLSFIFITYIFASTIEEEQARQLLFEHDFPAEEVLIAEIMETPEENRERVVQLAFDLHSRIPHDNEHATEVNIIRSLLRQIRQSHNLEGNEQLLQFLPSSQFENISPTNALRRILLPLVMFNGNSRERQNQIIDILRDRAEAQQIRTQNQRRNNSLNRREELQETNNMSYTDDNLAIIINLSSNNGSRESHEFITNYLRNHPNLRSIYFLAITRIQLPIQNQQESNQLSSFRVPELLRLNEDLRLADTREERSLTLRLALVNATLNRR